jgi:hypothetical protein
MSVVVEMARSIAAAEEHGTDTDRDCLDRWRSALRITSPRSVIQTRPPVDGAGFGGLSTAALPATVEADAPWSCSGETACPWPY